MHALLLSLCVLAADPAPSKLSGTVKDAAGRPVADVLIAVQFGYAGVSGASASVTRTNARGTYELAGIVDPPTPTYVQLLAVKPGFAVAHQSFERGGASGTRPAVWDVVLQQAVPQTITVVDPTGVPAAGVKLERLSIFRDNRTAGELLEPVLRELSITSDREGKLVLDVLPADHDLALAVQSSSYGRQRLAFLRTNADRTFRLRPVGTLAGKLTPPKGASAAGLNVMVEVRSADEPTFIGTADATTDDQAKFAIPAVAAGQAEVRVEAGPMSSVRPGPPVIVQIGRDKTTEVELQVVRAVKVTGTVVDLASGQGIAGAKVSLHNSTTNRDFAQAITDDKGVYSALLGGGQIGVRANEVPLPYYIGVSMGVGGKSAEDAESLTLDPIRVPRGRSREGTVVDTSGKPVAGAWVTAIWREQQDQYSTMGSRSVQSDAEGKFVLEGVASLAELYLRAETDDQAGIEYVTVPASAKEPTRLVISPAGAAVLAGRVVDEAGKPIAGAQVQVNAGYRRLAGRSEYDFSRELKWTLTSDAEGRFATPRPLRRTLANPGELKSFEWGGTFVTVTAPGRIQYQNQEKIGADGSPFVLPDIELAKEVTIRGRVTDRQGTPLAGATVWAPGIQEFRQARATTGADGRYELRAVHPQALFYFAHKEGFTFTGRAVPAGEADDEFALATPTEAAQDAPLVHRELSPEAKKAAVTKLLTPLWDQIDIKAHPYRHADILERIARHDPAYTVLKLQELPTPRYQVQILLAMGRTVDAAEAALALKSPYERSYTLVNIAHKTDDAEHRRQLLAESLLHARLVIEPERRLGALAGIAEALYDFGDKESAKPLIEEIRTGAEKLEAGFWRGYMAETVALIDVDAALKLCEGVTDQFERDRHPGNIAHEIAATDPARAEAILKSVSDRNQYRYIERVCYRMAPVDLERAQRIAESAARQYGDQRPYAYGVTALAMAKSNSAKTEPAKAKELLARACELLQPDFRGSDTRRQFDMGLALVHLCEQVDPARTRECLWRVVSLCPNTSLRTSGGWELKSKLEADAKLAILLARYDVHPDVAAKLVEPIFTTEMVELHELRERAFPFAMGLIDTDRSAQWLADYIKKAPADWMPNVEQPWHYMADAIGQDDAGFWNTLQKSILHQWVVDEEDF